eukprot:171517-Amphidinium_carterae.1
MGKRDLFWLWLMGAVFDVFQGRETQVPDSSSQKVDAPVREMIPSCGMSASAQNSSGLSGSPSRTVARACHVHEVGGREDINKQRPKLTSLNIRENDSAQTRAHG